MENKDIVGKKLYRLSERSYEGEIRGNNEGVNGDLTYIGLIKNIDNGWVTFSDNKTKCAIDNLKEGYLFLDLNDILSGKK